MVSRVTVGLVLVVVLLGSSARAGADARRPDPRAGGTGAVAYSVVRMSDGGIQFSGNAPNLQFRKAAYRDGHFDLQITSRNDRVDVQMNAFAIQVTRGKQTLSMATSALGTEGLAKIHALLAGSSAITRYREVAAAAEARSDRSPEAYGLILDGAVVGWLDGDANAPARLARRLAGTRAPDLLAPAGGRAAARLFQVRRPDCWGSYEHEAGQAMDDLVSCYGGAAQMSGFWQAIYDVGCTGEWTIRVEGYWFEYISCSTIPLRLS